MSKRTRRKRAGAIVGMIIAIIVLLGIAAVLFVQGRMGQVKRETTVSQVVPRSEQTFEVEEVPENEEPKPDTIAPEEIKWEKAEIVTPAPEKIEEIRNILLIGQDARVGQGRQRSDTMVIFSINEKTNKITMCSLMRDMYVPIPGYDDNRINAAYAFGGMPLLDQVIEEDFGVHIDGNIEVDLDGFLKSMSAIGPLDIVLTQEEADYLNANPGIGSNNDSVSSYGWELTEGMNSLTPEQALAYSRVRYIGHADYERTERQRRVLTTAFNKVITSDLKTLISLSDDLLPNFTTDMSQPEILDYIKTVKTNNMTLNETTYRLPVDGTYSSEYVRGMAVLVPDLAENSRYLHEYLYGEA